MTDASDALSWSTAAIRALPAYRQPQTFHDFESPGTRPRLLHLNENPYPPSPTVKAAIEAALAGRLERYPDPLGTAFRVRAAEVLGVSPDWILAGNGSDDILTIVTRALVGPGDRLRLPYPSYILYRTLAQLQGAEYEEVHFNADFSLPASFADGHGNLKLVFLPNPNSPSGTCIAPDALLELARQLPCPLLIDEAYVDFADTNCIELVKQDPRIMVSRTLSKSYALAGLRFGFLVAQPEMVAMFRKVKDSYNCDALSLAGATAAIDDQNWLQENRQRIIATRQHMTAALREMGFEVTDSHANFVWCTRSDRPVQPLFERLRNDGVLVRYMNYAGWGDGLRVSVGTDEQMSASLALLKSYL